jgi:hypothetical protein
MIHRDSVLLGPRSALRCGSAKYSTVTSAANRRVGTTSRARPSHWRGPARWFSGGDVGGGGAAVTGGSFRATDTL